MESELAFVAPEGVYVVAEEHKPSPLNAHIITPAVYPTRLSIILVHYPSTKPVSTPSIAQFLGGGRDNDRNAKVKNGEKGRDREKNQDDGRSLSGSDRVITDEDTSSYSQSQPPSPSPLFDGSKRLAAPSLAKKRSSSRPKHNIRTTTSTFVTRLQTTENLQKVLNSKQGDITFMFYNFSKSLYWTELGTKAREPLARISFSAYPTCHDVNKETANTTCLDVVIGFNTGDLVWFEPISGRYVRLNKHGCISNAPCTAVRWVPGSPSVFVVSHTDGSIVVYDKENEDGSLTPLDPSRLVPFPHPNHSESSSLSSRSEDVRSQGEWDPQESMVVTVPKWHPVNNASSFVRGRSGDRTSKNPISHWRISKRAVTDITYSQDARLVAATSEDGCLRIIDASQESLVACFASYFGLFTCVTFSSDANHAGGQDDLVTIFSVSECRVLARCQGHRSFVSSVAIDPMRSNKQSYRFGSVGEDNMLMLWDFSVEGHSGTKAKDLEYSTHNVSVSSYVRGRQDSTLQDDFPLSPSGLVAEESSKFCPAPGRSEVVMLKPILEKHLQGDLLTVISFTTSFLLTASKLGRTHVWSRPHAPRHRHLKSNPNNAHTSADAG